jgi:hypothetical protein
MERVRAHSLLEEEELDEELDAELELDELDFESPEDAFPSLLEELAAGLSAPPFDSDFAAAFEAAPFPE